jgi:transposase-like protein
MQQIQEDTVAPDHAHCASAVSSFHAGMLDQSAARWIIDHLHHTDGKRCPYCSTAIIDDQRLQRWYREERIKCSSSACGRFYTSRTGTDLEGSTLDAKELYLLKCLLELEVSAASIVKVIPINKETVSRWAQRFQSMEQLSA